MSVLLGKLLKLVTKIIVIILLILIMLVFARGTYQSAAGLGGLGLALVGTLTLLRERFTVEGLLSDREVQGWTARVIGVFLIAVGIWLAVANWPVF